MKHWISVGDNDVHFSNPCEGFDLSVDDNSLKFRPWEDAFSLFVCAVADYAHDNGLYEVQADNLREMEESLATALGKVREELARRGI